MTNKKEFLKRSLKKKKKKKRKKTPKTRNYLSSIIELAIGRVLLSRLVAIFHQALAARLISKDQTVQLNLEYFLNFYDSSGMIWHWSLFSPSIENLLFKRFTYLVTCLRLVSRGRSSQRIGGGKGIAKLPHPFFLSSARNNREAMGSEEHCANWGSERKKL